MTRTYERTCSCMHTSNIYLFWHLMRTPVFPHNKSSNIHFLECQENKMLSAGNNASNERVFWHVTRKIASSRNNTSNKLVFWYAMRKPDSMHNNDSNILISHLEHTCFLKVIVNQMYGCWHVTKKRKTLTIKNAANIRVYFHVTRKPVCACNNVSNIRVSWHVMRKPDSAHNNGSNKLVFWYVMRKSDWKT